MCAALHRHMRLWKCGSPQKKSFVFHFYCSKSLKDEGRLKGCFSWTSPGPDGRVERWKKARKRGWTVLRCQICYSLSAASPIRLKVEKRKFIRSVSFLICINSYVLRSTNRFFCSVLTNQVAVAVRTSCHGDRNVFFSFSLG